MHSQANDINKIITIVQTPFGCMKTSPVTSTGRVQQQQESDQHHVRSSSASYSSSSYCYFYCYYYWRSFFSSSGWVTNTSTETHPDLKSGRGPTRTEMVWFGHEIEFSGSFGISELWDFRILIIYSHRVDIIWILIDKSNASTIEVQLQVLVCVWNSQCEWAFSRKRFQHIYPKYKIF